MKCYPVFTALAPSVLTSYSKSVLNDSLGATILWHTSVQWHIILGLVLVCCTAERAMVRFQCFEPQMWPSSSSVLFCLLSGICYFMDHNGFASDILGSALDPDLVTLAYCRLVGGHMWDVLKIGLCIVLQTVHVYVCLRVSYVTGSRYEWEHNAYMLISALGFVWVAPYCR